jgi:hypothetical protein
MGDGIHINRTAERFSSHTQMRMQSHGGRSSGQRRALREKLISAMVQIVAGDGDPRLIKSRALP